MIRDPKVRAIFPVRGGFGLTRIVDRIDYAALRNDPKIITGYSDLTALHLAVARQARVVTFHSPLVMHNLWQVDKPDHAFAADAFRRAVFADRYPKGQTGYVIPVPADAKPAKLIGGTARGRCSGGNLSLICATLGTPYAIQPKGAILFVEDVNEAPYRVDRMLSQLRLAGVLDEVAGVVVGSFTTKEPGRGRGGRAGGARVLRGPQGSGGDRLPGRPRPAERDPAARRTGRTGRRPRHPADGRRPRSPWTSDRRRAPGPGRPGAQSDRPRIRVLTRPRSGRPSPRPRPAPGR